MDLDEDVLFLGNIPESFNNELLIEMLSVFGEIKEFKRGKDLEGTDSKWVIVSYYEKSSISNLYCSLLNRDLGQGMVVVFPQKKELQAWEVSDEILGRVDDIAKRYKERLKKEDCLEKFVSSYDLLYGSTGDGQVFSEALSKWLDEESEIRRRCRKAENDFERTAERKRQEEYYYLSTYDDDRSNDLFYTDRVSWALKRNKDDVK
ncbi:uncharacterized protein Eint_110350 [Encephalitozoon intestinalis ATCC 50506]|uniref:RRM domain-containing protein n=1 Tax=Encephalitozoon intestinalis (strain ATCC 50506) TaxID=876142 RepID=E0SAB0_ENCIT|nr:uncharacterized protein Eint_110350 [Encephalitozoon intestinalis ATCC 50506]ADM12535.1 hypothetical protein Eint_110350 [Encephalitozoon intestinalis ATCC 50506]UTX46388.1 hypothetical protein GPK93_11g19950 [Encephalitozoon intestinalis]